MLDETNNTIKKPEQIREILATSGIDTTKPIIASCNSGMTATYMLAALQSIGIDKVPLYDGSWQEYSNKKKAE